MIIMIIAVMHRVYIQLKLASPLQPSSSMPLSANNTNGAYHGHDDVSQKATMLAQHGELFDEYQPFSLLQSGDDYDHDAVIVHSSNIPTDDATSLISSSSSPSSLSSLPMSPSSSGRAATKVLLEKVDNDAKLARTWPNGMYTPMA